MPEILNGSLDIKLVIFSLIGGLAIFLFAMNFMSDNLKKLAGSKLRLILEKTTNTPIKGVITGLVLTSLIQSSSATTAIVVGLVSAGLLTLRNSIGVVLGAKIGTTVTSVLISFNIGALAYPIIFIGSILMMFFKRKKIQYIGGSILGFGLLFLGLNTMGDALADVATQPWFAKFLTSAGNTPILGLLVGVGTTMLIQSSSATIGILQTLYTTGAVPLVAAIGIVLGSNIGTTVTAVIASVVGSKDSKKVSLIYVTMNVIGSFLFLLIVKPYAKLIELISRALKQNPANSMVTISLTHIIYNVLFVLVFFWLIDLFVKLANRIIKDDDRLIEEVVLNKHLIKSSPELALANAKQAIEEMGNLTVKMFDYAFQYAFEDDEKAKELGLQSEEILNHLDVDIHNFLVEIGSFNISDRQMQLVAKHIDTVTDLERIGDHLENLFEFFEARKEEKTELSEETKEEFLHLFNIVKYQLKNSLEAYFNQDLVLASKTEKNEFELNRLVKEYRSNYIMRISDSKETSQTNHYVDIISNLERVGDHCYNIVENVLYKKFTYKKKEIRA